MEMSSTGDKALQGIWEDFTEYAFVIKEDMVLDFEGKLCVVKDTNGNKLSEWKQSDGQVSGINVLNGNICVVIRGRVRLRKK